MDLDELVARIERHVQRQHCIKLELEKAMEDAKAMMAQLERATKVRNLASGCPRHVRDRYIFYVLLL